MAREISFSISAANPKNTMLQRFPMNALQVESIYVQIYLHTWAETALVGVVWRKVRVRKNAGHGIVRIWAPAPCRYPHIQYIHCIHTLHYNTTLHIQIQGVHLAVEVFITPANLTGSIPNRIPCEWNAVNTESIHLFIHTYIHTYIHTLDLDAWGKS